MSAQARRIKQLQADASAFMRAGEPKQALEKLAQLELLDPREPDFPRRAAECHRLLAEPEQYLEALARAAKAYVAMDLVVKAIAICKMMLAQDPRHPAALAWMSQLQSPLAAQPSTLPSRAPRVVEKSVPASSEPEPPTAVTVPSAARRLVAKKGLVAVARMVARKTPRTPPKAASIVVEALPPAAEPPESNVEVLQPVEAGPMPQLAQPPALADSEQFAETLELVESRPALCEDDAEIAESVEVSTPPLAAQADLRLIVPGSCAWPEGQKPPSGLFRLAVDTAEPAADPQTLRQARGILPAIPLFAEMDPHSLASLVRQSRLIQLRAGEVVFEQDDPPDCLYVVVNGSIAMFDEAANVELYRVSENEFFGEGALISNDPQPTTARAAEDCDLLAFDRDSMRNCIVDNLNVVPVLLRFLRSRMLEHLVRTSPLFAHLDTAERRALSRKFEFIEMSEGALLIEQGARSPGLFVLMSGAVDVIRSDGEREEWLATLERGGMFGEISLLGGSVAEANVRSVTSGLALMLPAAAFRDVIMTHPPVLEVLSVMSEERKQANERRLSPAKRSAVRSPSEVVSRR